MKKTSIIYNLLGVILCGLATPATADFCSQTCNDCCEWSVLDGKATLSADWLYWKVQQDGILPGVVSVVTEATDLEPRLVSRERIRNNSKWSNGFRVSLGYEMPCECWDINLCYTYLPSRRSLVNFNGIGEDLSLNFSDDSAFATFASKWHLNFNNVDLDIGRLISFGECLKLRPHVGIRATWFDQKYSLFGTEPISGAIAQAEEIIKFPSSFLARRTKEKFQGYGIEAGLWTDYKLGYGLSLVGHFGGSILYSKFTVCDKSVNGIINSPDVSTVTEAARERGSFCTATPSLDTFVGLMYADVLCDMIFNVHAGWEQHVLFDTNRFLSHGNLSGQGLTFGLAVGF
jgi:hypothetical protein